MNVLSLFNGMGCGWIALDEAGIKVDKRFSSEIDKPANEVNNYNYPDTIQLGDIQNIHYTNLGLEVDLTYSKLQCYSGQIDLIMGGSPCQGFSLQGKQQRFNDERSKLFFEYLRILKEVIAINPKVLFLLENVKMGQESQNVISGLLKTRPIKLNSSLVSAQNRNRLYWTNISVNTIPKDRKIKLKDILQDNVDEQYFLKEGRLKWLLGDSGKRSLTKRYCGIDLDKAVCITRRAEASWNCNYVTDGGRIRTLTPIEYERLQNVPDDYTKCVSNKHRYEMLGNGWTVGIISHIFKHIK